MQVSSGASFPITNYLAPVSAGGNVSANGTVLKTAGGSTGVMQLPGGFTFMPGKKLYFSLTRALLQVLIIFFMVCLS